MIAAGKGAIIIACLCGAAAAGLAKHEHGPCRARAPAV